jgi:hypothetical protein
MTDGGLFNVFQTTLLWFYNVSIQEHRGIGALCLA